MSASSIPTRAPLACNAKAKFTVTDDLPTPPLPEATAITLRLEMAFAAVLRGSASTFAVIFHWYDCKRGSLLTSLGASLAAGKGKVRSITGPRILSQLGNKP